MSPSWWTIHGDDIMAALRRVDAGETPDAVYADMYSKAERDLSDPWEITPGSWVCTCPDDWVPGTDGLLHHPRCVEP